MKHTEIAQELFSKKYYCSQAVLGAFAEELGMNREQALMLLLLSLPCAFVKAERGNKDGI